MGKLPLCMNQYKPIFTTSRLPTPNQDTLITLTPSSHIVVIHHNHMFSMEVLRDNKPLPTLLIEKHLQEIITQSSTLSQPHHSVGIMTGGHRDTWANARTQLLNGNPCNKESLDLIE